MGNGEDNLLFGPGIHTRKQKRKFLYQVKLSSLYRLIIPICSMIDQLTIKTRNPFSKVKTVITVGNIKFRRTDMFSKRIVIKWQIR